MCIQTMLLLVGFVPGRFIGGQHGHVATDNYNNERDCIMIKKLVLAIVLGALCATGLWQIGIVTQPQTIFLTIVIAFACLIYGFISSKIHRDPDAFGSREKSIFR